MSIHKIETDLMETHIIISCRYNQLSRELEHDTAGCLIGDKMIQLLQTYSDLFHCSRAMAYQRIKNNSFHYQYAVA